MASSPARLVNFNAGPGPLPVAVLERAQKDLLCWNQSVGMSVMEMSHRSKEFESILNTAIADLQDLLAIPKNFKVLFLQGGATTQFAAIPLNFLGAKTTAEYLVTGVWSEKAAEEAAKYCKVHVAASNKENGYTQLPDKSTITRSPDESAYFYFCANETVNGVEIQDINAYLTDIDPRKTVVIGDFSSNFCSRPIDFTKMGVVYAGAQKNIGPAGVTLVIIRDDLLGKGTYGPHKMCPIMFNFKIMADNNSLYNTPPCFAIYMCGLVFQWLKTGSWIENGSSGGIQCIEKRNTTKADLVYSCIDSLTDSDGRPVFHCPIDRSCRSRMNIIFRIRGGDKELESKFVAAAEAKGLVGLGGHRSVGGLRASLYNAVSIEDCHVLLEFMKAFAQSL